MIGLVAVERVPVIDVAFVQQRGDALQPRPVGVDVTADLDLEVGQSVGLDRSVQRCGQAVIDLVFGQDFVVGEWIDHADRMPNDDPLQRPGRQQVRRRMPG